MNINIPNLIKSAVPEAEGRNVQILSDNRSTNYRGMVSQVTLLPEKNVGIVILSNQQAFSALSAVTHEVLEDVLELKDIKAW